MNRFLLLAALLASPGLTQAQSWQWVAGATGPGNARILATATDGAGGTVVAGDFTGTITLGGTTLTSAGNRDVFVARLNNAGTFTQAVRAGGTAEDYAIDLILDASGMATVLGGFYSATAEFGPTVLTKANLIGGAEIFVAQLSSTGTWTRAVHGGINGVNFPSALALNAAGEAVVTGFFYGSTTSFGSTTLTNVNPSSTNADIFVARLSSAGTWTQAARAGGSGDDRAEGVALAADGTVVVAGSFRGPTMDLGTFSLLNADLAGQTNDVFVARLGTAGTWSQASRAGGPAADLARRLALDAAGNATVVGSFSSSTISFGSFALTNAGGTTGSSDVFAARFTPAGTWSQAVRAGGSGSETALAVAVSANGQATVGGLFSSPTATFSNLSLSNADANGFSNDLFVARLNSAGAAWTQAVRAGAGSDEAVVDLDLTGSGEATIAGLYLATTTIGSTTLNSTTTTDNTGFVARTTGLTLGVRHATDTSPLAVYPNPATAGTAMLRLSAPATAAQTLTVRDALGRVVRQATIATGRQEVALPTAGLSPGVYLAETGLSRAQLVVE
ncbi:T9SS type A sorting domain-containing protein [Hymenobacter chitinivorans]|uniref:Putative secreted protein (Por secretion system target) n=1 Tax=Hymenobacter chitinivorans DSM 11115 TaxID=1121954 RepID=A0A2M9BTK7_9BACT|nr:T9SS type A sorting domain-containing protein [Hymenobacter chitinivorans]PJJ61289.1 putative secreted protein (Por secretion system target) [Hymenobacter chitinivorans DSM 11115]